MRLKSKGDFDIAYSAVPALAKWLLEFLGIPRNSQP